MIDPNLKREFIRECLLRNKLTTSSGFAQYPYLNKSEYPWDGLPDAKNTHYSFSISMGNSFLTEMLDPDQVDLVKDL